MPILSNQPREPGSSTWFQTTRIPLAISFYQWFFFFLGHKCKYIIVYGGYVNVAFWGWGGQSNYNTWGVKRINLYPVFKLNIFNYRIKEKTRLKFRSVTSEYPSVIQRYLKKLYLCKGGCGQFTGRGIKGYRMYVKNKND